MVQINTPYPATAYLKGFLRKSKPEVEVFQEDAGLELVLKLFSKRGLHRLKKEIAKKKNPGPASLFFLGNFSAYEANVEKIVEFLQGKAPLLAKEILKRRFPMGPRFQPLEEYENLQADFEVLSAEDRAKHLGALFLDELADIVSEAVDPEFSFSRYGERLAASQSCFTPLYIKLREKTLLTQMLDEIAEEFFRKHEPDAVALSLPFSGTVYAGLRLGRFFKNKGLPVIAGGGYASTELRSLADPRVFEFVDYVCLDDGEKPLSLLLDHLGRKIPKEKLLRTFVLEQGKVALISDPSSRDVSFRETGTPDYTGLPLDRYVSMLEMLNEVNRLWTDSRWNKITVAHGCYWHKCSFCDVSLDYIRRYEMDEAGRIVDKMVEIHASTGWTNFHFVDEAAPPVMLRAISERLIARGLKFRWWGNIRFDKSFTRETTELMAKAGCIAVSGGLEVASPRILKLINKGVSVEQVAKVTRNFMESGILVHAYLMYGFPTQTTLETVDSLEVVRQLFREKCIGSAFWHRFACTVHSPVARDPDKFGIKLLPKDLKEPLFAENDIPFHDPTETDHDALGEGLRSALYNYMHGVGFDIDLRQWFPVPVPNTQISATLIRDSLQSRDP